MSEPSDTCSINKLIFSNKVLVKLTYMTENHRYCIQIISYKKSLQSRVITPLCKLGTGKHIQNFLDTVTESHFSIANYGAKYIQ